MLQMPVILGPTACGKTSLAARLAFELDGEVISADSRQVYRGMDLGTGKDLSEYIVEGKAIPYHLIDLVDPGYEYNIFEYQRDFRTAYRDITGRGKLPVLCGGSGMYLESVLKGYDLPEISQDPGFSLRMSGLDDEELLKELKIRKKLHGTTDTTDRARMIRALEIEMKRGDSPRFFSPVPHMIFGIMLERKLIRERITARLQIRLRNGMTEEVRKLLEQGVPPERLKAYGLEYKFLTLYLQNEISYDEMFRLLNTAIHQFAKRQMTWFRRMERQGMKIHWIEGESSSADKVKMIREILSK